MNGIPKSVANSYRTLFTMAHGSLHGAVQGIDAQAGRWEPNDLVPPIQAQYVHIAVSEDTLINAIVRGSAPLCATMFGGRTGWQGEVPITNWNAWARAGQINLPMVMEYAHTVFGATEYWLGQIDDMLLQRPCDASLLGMGMLPASAVLNLALSNVFLHTGEISCLKGMQGLAGYAEKAHVSPTETILSDEELAALFA
jgi:hypothetical protein